MERNSISKKRRIKDNESFDSIRYESFGESLCLPEFCILIVNMTNCIDVSALGAGTDLMYQYHYVVDEKCAASLSAKDIILNQTLLSSWVRIGRLTKIMWPSSSTKRKNNLRCKYILFRGFAKVTYL